MRTKSPKEFLCGDEIFLYFDCIGDYTNPDMRKITRVIHMRTHKLMQARKMMNAELGCGLVNSNVPKSISKF